MMNRWIAITAVTLLTGACARGGEGDADAALVDSTAQSAELIGDTTAVAPAPLESAPVVDSAAAPAEPAMDSAAAPAATEAHDGHGDSAAHP